MSTRLTVVVGMAMLALAIATFFLTADVGGYATRQVAETHAEHGSPTCIRFGGCGYLDKNDRRLIAVDNWADGRTIIAAAKCNGRWFSVADRSGKGGGAGVRRLPCNGTKHLLERKDPNGNGPTLWRYSNTSRHPN